MVSFCRLGRISSGDANKEEAEEKEKKKGKKKKGEGSRATTVWGEDLPVCSYSELKRILGNIRTNGYLFIDKKTQKYVAYVGNEFCVGFARRSSSLAKSREVSSQHVFETCKLAEYSCLYNDIGQSWSEQMSE